MSPHPLAPLRAQALGPAAAAAVEAFRRPTLPAGLRYTLLMRPGVPCSAKPLAFRDTGELARHLHRARAGAGLQLQDAELKVREDEHPRRGVSVWTLDPDTGARRSFLGFAHLGGAGRASLEAALRAEETPEVAYG